MLGPLLTALPETDHIPPGQTPPAPHLPLRALMETVHSGRQRALGSHQPGRLPPEILESWTGRQSQCEDAIRRQHFHNSSPRLHFCLSAFHLYRYHLTVITCYDNKSSSSVIMITYFPVFAQKAELHYYRWKIIKYGEDTSIKI